MASIPPLNIHGNGDSDTENTTITKPSILHLGGPIAYNRDLYSRLQDHFEIRRPLPHDLARQNFIQHLKDKTWGDFSAIVRPFWNTGGEMGRWDPELIDLLPQGMKVMASAGAGFDWVDTKSLGKKGILYCNGAGASTESVADMALYLLISVFRQMTWSSLAARSNSSSQWREAHEQVPFASHNPRGHTLGIVGLGNIGFAIAKKVNAALGMRLIYYDVLRKGPETEREAGATYHENLETLLKESDCVLLATPGGPPLLNSRTLSLLPPGARVVNVARGSLIDEDALADALESKHLSAAGLDVSAHEPNVSERLSRMRNVTLTSHTGGGSVQTVEAFERLVMLNVEAVLEGREPLTAVNHHYIKTESKGTGRVREEEGDRSIDGEKMDGEGRAAEFEVGC